MVLLRWGYGGTPMWIVQHTDFEQVVSLTTALGNGDGGAQGDRRGMVLVRCWHGIAPMWVGQLVDFEHVMKAIEMGRTKEPRRREERGEKDRSEGAQLNHLSVTAFQVAESGRPPRPSRLCGLKGLPSTTWIRLGSGSPARPQIWL